MTDRERNLAIFGHSKGCGVLWQPRLNNWHRCWQQARAREGKPDPPSLIEMHDTLGASIRPYMYYRKSLVVQYDASISVSDAQKPDGMLRTYTTPLGTLNAFYSVTQEGYCWTKYPVENVQDISIMKYVLEGTHYRFDRELFEKAEMLTGDRATSQTIAPRTGLQEIFVNLMGVQRGVYAFADQPWLMDDFQLCINRSYDSYYEAVCASPISIVNFGDNLHCKITPPSWFVRYVLPWYQLRTARLHASGIYCMSHWDGDVKAYLPYIQDTGLDGIEAITLKPQGDVLIDEVYQHMGDKVLIDGIPAVYFLNHFPVSVMEELVHKLLELFSGRLVLGISDEMPGDGVVQRVGDVSGWVRQHNSCLQ